VFNHASRGFFQFNHVLENGAQSPYLSWFHFTEFPVNAYIPEARPNYAAWWGISELPKFNINSPMVREFLWQVGRYWIERGIDGWRLDVPNEIDDPLFWAEFRHRMRQVNPEAYIVGEIWNYAGPWLQGDQFDAVMNYPFTRACLGFFGRETLDAPSFVSTGLGQVPLMRGTEFGHTIASLLTLYPPQAVAVQMNLLDSHDTPRFLTMVADDESALRLALLCQMTYPGAPCIYYGDEIGMFGGKDPECRRAMIWDPARWNHEMLAYFRRVIALRHAHPALRRGAFKLLLATEDMVAYARVSEAEVVIVLLNAGLQPWQGQVPVAEVAGDGLWFREVWSGHRAQVAEGQMQELRVPARSGLVYIRKGDS
jgi:neopullulanase